MMATFLPQLGCILVIVGIYVAVSWGLAAGGWRRLGREYRAGGNASGLKFRSTTATVGGTFMQGTGVVISEAGLYLYVALPMVLLFHPPLLIPWRAMTRQGDEPNWRNHDTLQILVETTGRPVNISVRGPAAKAISDRMELSPPPIDA